MADSPNVRHIAAPLLPSDADPRTATGRTLGWGVISTGRIADKVTPDIALLEDARLEAVSSRSHASAEAFAARHGFAKAYGDDGESTGLSRLLADPDVDVVYVATPHGQHFAHAKAALEAGKHVVCEKAFTITAAEARELMEIAAQRRLFLMEALWTRFQPGSQRIIELIEEGAIGSPTWVQADLGFAAPQDPAHRIWRVDAGGGALLDLGVYVLTWAWASMGFPVSVSAAAQLNEDGVDALTALSARFAGGGMAQMQMSLLSECPSTAAISGTGGSIVVDKPMHSPRGATLTRTSPAASESGESAPVERIEFPLVGRGYIYEMREATTRIQRGELESPVMPWSDTLRQMELFDALREEMGVQYPNDAPRDEGR